MKNRRFHSIMAFGLLTFTMTVAVVRARTWTSASDSSRKFEAEYIGFKKGVVTVKLKTGNTASFPINTLSPADRKFVADQQPGASTPDKASLNVFTVLKDQLVTVTDGKATPFAFVKGKEPSHILLYVSAYW